MFFKSDARFCIKLFNRLLMACKYEEQYRKITAEYAAISKDNQQKEKLIYELLSELDNMKDTNHELKDQIQLREKVIKNLQSEITELTKSAEHIEDLEYQSVRLEQQLIMFEQQLEVSNSENLKLCTKLNHCKETQFQLLEETDMKNEQLEKLSNNLMSAENKIICLQYELDELSKKLEDNSTQMLVQDTEARLYETYSSEATDNLIKLETELLNTKEQLILKQRDNEYLRGHIKSLDNQLILSEEIATKHYNELNAYKESHKYHNEQYEELKVEINKLACDLDEKLVQCNFTSKRLNKLKECCMDCQISNCSNHDVTYQSFYLDETCYRL